MANNLDIKCDKDGVKLFDSIAWRKYASCPKSSWTHVILFKITAALSGEYFDKKYYNVYVYTSEQYTFSIGVIIIYILPGLYRPQGAV